MKKYNRSTGCYKIDLFINGMYVASTDQSKTCKEAMQKYRAKWVLGETEKLTAKYKNPQTIIRTIKLIPYE